MKKKWMVVLIFSLAVASFSWAGNNATLPKQKLYRHTPDDGSRKTFIVKFRSGKAMESFVSGKRLPVEPTHQFHRFDMVAVQLSGQEAAELSRDKDVLLVQEDQTYYLHAAGPYGRLPERLQKGRFHDASVTATGFGGVIPAEEYQWNIQKMGVEDYHRRGFMGRGVKVGVIDTGIDIYHPDLHVVGGVELRTSAVQDRYSDVSATAHMWPASSPAGSTASGLSGWLRRPSSTVSLSSTSLGRHRRAPLLRASSGASTIKWTSST
jgi:hypothetical protein